MGNFLDDISEYIKNATTSTVRGGPGYQASQDESMLRPLLRPEEPLGPSSYPQQQPQRSPYAPVADMFSDIKSKLGNAFQPVRASYTAPQEQITASSKAFQDMVSGMGIPSGYKNNPNLKYGDSPFAGYIMSQANSNANPSNIEYLNSVVLPLTRKYGIPDELAAGQWAAEGRYVNPETNNFWNLMYGGQVHPYENMDNMARDYDLTLKDIMSRNMGKDKESFNYGDYDVMTLLNALQSGQSGNFEGHSPRPLEYVDLVSNTPEFRYFAGQ